MTQHDRGRAHPYTIPGRSLLERVLLGIIGLAILVLAFFFLTIALVAGALVAGVILVRWWWLTRKIRAAQADEVIEGEFTTVEREVTEHRIGPPER